MMNLRKMRHVPCKGAQMPFCGVLYDIYILLINGRYVYGYMLYARLAMNMGVKLRPRECTMCLKKRKRKEGEY